MASVLAPNWTDNVSVIAITTVARNAVLRATMDYRSKLGAYLYWFIGRGGTTALSAGIDVRVGRTVNNGGIIVPNETVPFRGQLSAAISTTCAAAGNGAGSTSLTVASTGSFAAGDIICIQDNAAPTSLTEWCKVARVTDATHFLLVSPTQQAHNSVAHTVRNMADVGYAFLEGGATWEIIFDYGNQSTGDTATVLAVAQTLDTYTAT